MNLVEERKTQSSVPAVYLHHPLLGERVITISPSLTRSLARSLTRSFSITFGHHAHNDDKNTHSHCARNRPGSSPAVRIHTRTLTVGAASRRELARAVFIPVFYSAHCARLGVPMEPLGSLPDPASVCRRNWTLHSGFRK